MVRSGVLTKREMICLKYRWEFLRRDKDYQNLNELAEDRVDVLRRVKEKSLKDPKSQIRRAVNAYAGERTKLKFNQWMSEEARRI